MKKEEFFRILSKARACQQAYPIPEKEGGILYHELKNEVDGDLYYAFKQLANGDDKINLANIKRHINEKKSMRLAEEAAKRRQMNAEGIKLPERAEIPETAKKALDKLFNRSWGWEKTIDKS